MRVDGSLQVKVQKSSNLSKKGVLKKVKKSSKFEKKGQKKCEKSGFSGPPKCQKTAIFRRGLGVV